MVFVHALRRRFDAKAALIVILVCVLGHHYTLLDRSAEKLISCQAELDSHDVLLEESGCHELQRKLDTCEIAAKAAARLEAHIEETKAKLFVDLLEARICAREDCDAYAADEADLQVVHALGQRGWTCG